MVIEKDQKDEQSNPEQRIEPLTTNLYNEKNNQLRHSFKGTTKTKHLLAEWSPAKLAACDAAVAIVLLWPCPEGKRSGVLLPGLLGPLTLASKPKLLEKGEPNNCDAAAADDGSLPQYAVITDTFSFCSTSKRETDHLPKRETGSNKDIGSGPAPP